MRGSDRNRDHRAESKGQASIHVFELLNSNVIFALQSIAVHGVGKWREMREALLPEWEEATLRVKAALLLGSQSLARYAGWKGDR